MKIVADCYIPNVSRAFSGIAEVITCEPAALTPAMLEDCDALLVRTVTRVNAALLENTPVRFVGTATSGSDHIDLDYLSRHDIGFADAAGSNARPVAEYVLSAIAVLCEQRGLRFSNLDVAVIGCGHVGSLLAEMLHALGANTLLNDPPLEKAGDPREFVDLDTAMTADVVTLHVPLTMTGDNPTYRLVDEQKLARLQDGAMLINTARGGVVDESALGRAIRERGLRAVVDVWQDEPDIDMQLAARVMLGTPHIAGYSLGAKLRATDCMRAALLNYFNLEHGRLEEEAIQEQAVRIPLPPAGFDEQARLAILAGYDVRSDAATMQRLLRLPAGERGSWFTGLRQDYVLRHEFSALGPELPAAGDDVIKRFRSLGFRMT